MVALRVAGVADAPEALPLVDVLALLHRDRAFLEMHEGVVEVFRVAIEDHVPARAARLVLDVFDRPRARSDDRDPFRSQQVLALMCVAVALGAELRVVSAVAEDAAQGDTGARTWTCGTRLRCAPGRRI